MDKAIRLLELLRDLATGPAGLAIFAAAMALFEAALRWKHETQQTAHLRSIDLELQHRNDHPDTREDSGSHRTHGGRRNDA